MNDKNRNTEVYEEALAGYLKLLLTAVSAVGLLIGISLITSCAAS